MTLPSEVSYYLPVAIVGFWGMWGSRRFRIWHDPRYVTHPEQRVWTLARICDDDEWTEAGRRARTAYLRHWLFGVVITIAAFAISGWVG